MDLSYFSFISSINKNIVICQLTSCVEIVQAKVTLYHCIFMKVKFIMLFIKKIYL